MEISKQAYQKLIFEDMQWLYDHTEDCAERHRILLQLWDSTELSYPDVSDPKPAVEPIMIADLKARKYLTKKGWGEVY